MGSSTSSSGCEAGCRRTARVLRDWCKGSCTSDRPWAVSLFDLGRHWPGRPCWVGPGPAGPSQAGPSHKLHHMAETHSSLLPCFALAGTRCGSHATPWAPPAPAQALLPSMPLDQLSLLACRVGAIHSPVIVGYAAFPGSLIVGGAPDSGQYHAQLAHSTQFCGPCRPSCPAGGTRPAGKDRHNRRTAMQPSDGMCAQRLAQVVSKAGSDRTICIAGATQLWHVRKPAWDWRAHLCGIWVVGVQHGAPVPAHPNLQPPRIWAGAVDQPDSGDGCEAGRQVGR